MEHRGGRIALGEGKRLALEEMAKTQGRVEELEEAIRGYELSVDLFNEAIGEDVDGAIEELIKSEEKLEQEIEEIERGK